MSSAAETTLGGATMTALLDPALRLGQTIYISYVGLEGVDLHIARVRARVALGGHDVPEERIRQRYDSSRANLVRLLPRLTEGDVRRERCRRDEEVDSARHALA
jgi:predicted ABC-type ATPase